MSFARRPFTGFGTRALLALLLFACAGFAPALARQFTVSAGASEIVFDDITAAPLRWTLCLPDCAATDARRAVLFAADDGYLRLTPPSLAVSGPSLAKSSALARELSLESLLETTSGSIPGSSQAAFSSVVIEQANSVVVEFTRAAERYRYELARDTASLTLELSPGTGIALATGAQFIPEQLPGFGSIYSDVRPVQVDASGQRIVDNEQGAVEVQADSTNWTGIRNRYWTLLLQPQDPLQAHVEVAAANRPVIEFAAANSATPTRLKIYAGPIEWQTLRTVAPELSNMLFAALWDFLRALCFGMLLLLDWIHRLTGNYGIAIILLSLSIKILMSPLTLLADRWQADVNRQHTLLKPELEHIKRNFKGEDAHLRVLEVYKRNGVSQFYTFKSAAGFLIQIPVFIAAFDMLADNIALHVTPFLWIRDLGVPDRLAELPFVLPFFGGWLNLLPFLMTGLSVLAAWLQADTTLSADLQRQQSVRLYLMSVAFFVLFYTFPAGMVLYWTSSNLFHLLKVEGARVVSRLRQA